MNMLEAMQCNPPPKKKKKNYEGVEWEKIQPLKKWAWAKSMERWEKTWSMCLKALNHEALKWDTTNAIVVTMFSSLLFDTLSFSNLPIVFKPKKWLRERYFVREREREIKCQNFKLNLLFL